MKLENNIAVLEGKWIVKNANIAEEAEVDTEDGQFVIIKMPENEIKINLAFSEISKEGNDKYEIVSQGLVIAELVYRIK